MADWDLPTLTSTYADFLAYLKARDEDAATMFVSAPTNPQESFIRFVRASNKLQEYLSAVWTDVNISVAGGGTGAGTASGARTNLGLGTIATQNANNVTITGGSIAGAAISASDLNSGTIPDARFPATLPVISGVNLTALNASNLASGTVADARLPTNSTKVDWGADQSGNFTAVINKGYHLTGSSNRTIALPTVVGNDGKRIVLVNYGTAAWTLDPNGAQTILGAATWDFDFGTYSSITLIANEAATNWDVL